MADSVWVPTSASAVPATTVSSRHSAVVRVTHWITTLCFLALLVSGVEILISHPRFYWGETGNVLTPPLFKLPIPASRSTVPTGYGYVLPDQNGWSRYLHFQAAWACCIDRLTLPNLRIAQWAFPAEFAPRSRRPFLAGALDGNRQTFALHGRRARQKPGRITCFSGSRICSLSSFCSR